jgi:hypothetical protein
MDRIKANPPTIWWVWFLKKMSKSFVKKLLNLNVIINYNINENA